jgi:4-hydroxy-tetrahydrodipicolinate reductase
MKILVLGRGKTGSLVAEVARARGHEVDVLCSADNPHAASLTPDRLRDVAVLIDFTTPQAVLEHINAAVRAERNIVVGTTGWYDDLATVRQMVEKAGTGFLYASNFSIGVNLFFDVVRTASAAMYHHYSGEIFERHHRQKKDAPSGTALVVQKIIQESSGKELEITSFREGDVVGMHEVVLNSLNDTIYLCHDAKSRRAFAEGAVRAAEWLAGKTGFYDFKDIWRHL